MRPVDRASMAVAGRGQEEYWKPKSFLNVWGVFGTASHDYLPPHKFLATAMPVRSCVHMRNFSRVNRDEKGARRLQYILKMAPRELISIVPLVVALSTHVILPLQLNGILLKWKIQQIRRDTATKATKRSSTHAQLKYFHP